MSDITYPRLCGGIFFSLILLAMLRRKTSKEHAAGLGDIVTEPQVLAGLVQVMNAGASVKYINRSVTSRFKSCQTLNNTDMPFGDTPEVREFDMLVRQDYTRALAAMSSFTDEYLETDTGARKGLRLACALVDLILQDNGIGAEEKFYIQEDGIPVRKSEFGGLTIVCLPSLLLGVWHYILLTIKDNSVGAKTHEMWWQSEAKGGKKKFAGNIGECLMTKITLRPIMSVEGSDSEKQNSVVIMPEFNDGNAGSKQEESSGRNGQYIYMPVSVNQAGTNCMNIGVNFGIAKNI